jgi:hypothetical protein
MDIVASTERVVRRLAGVQDTAALHGDPAVADRGPDDREDPGRPIEVHAAARYADAAVSADRLR